jgi:cobalt-zinc-cadmium efflux system outer membrane protein
MTKNNSNNFMGLLSLLACLFIIFESHAEQLPVQSNSGDSITIESVIDRVLQNNDRLAAAKYMEQAAYSKIGTAGAWDDPMLMVGVANLPTNFDFKMDPMTMRMISLSQNIPYAGQKHFQAKAARAEAQAASQDTRGTQVELIRAARYAYYDLYYQQQALIELGNIRTLAENIVNSTIGRLKSNQANQADIAAAQADMWRLDSEILSATQACESSRRNLYSLMGDGEINKMPLAAPELPQLTQTVDEMYTAALANYPPLQKMRHQAASYALSETAANRMRWPMLGLSAEYDLRYDSPMEKRDNMVGFKASISLPFFSGWQQKNMASSMNLMKKGAESEAAQMEIDIRSELATLSGRITRLGESLKLYRDRIIPAGEQAYQSALASFAANQLGYNQIQNYAQNLYRDKLTAIQIANELAKATADIQSYINLPDGQMDKSIGK